MNLLNLMRQFSIRMRMLGAIGVVLALMGVVGGSGLWGMQQLSHLGDEFVDHAFAETQALGRMRLALADLSRYEKDMVIHYESPEQLSLARMRWEQTLTGLRKEMGDMLGGKDDEDNAVVRSMDAHVQDYAAAVQPVIKQIEAGAYDSATVANRMLERAHTAYAQLLKDMTSLDAIIAGEAGILSSAMDSTSTRTIQWFGLAVVLACLVVVPTTLANMQSICRPLAQAESLARSIAGGDLTSQVRVEGRDELTRLTDALGGMQASLSRVVGELRQSTEYINTASAEIASGNQDLSERTEQAAGNLQQTATSVDQINGTVRQSADAARQASQMAVANAEVAARGGAVVGEVVSTMEDINRSSQKIADIIGVIDGIAFQTNILALNAAVEAARAGEQGRGFAVVAGEVRSLAQRSAQAAREIKGLIDSSVERAEAGTRLVGEAGSTIGEIVTNAEQVSAFIRDITTAADEQSQGMDQVNQAVGNLDQMTQQNAALVEQSAAAAASLQEQAQKLASLVSTFRLPAA
ncbi:MAG: methyl-accepting chemotaxis protein [Burkholderiaceae bacterium]